MSTELCSYGCGQLGVIFSKGRQTWRCANSPSTCPVNKAKNREGVLAKFNSLSCEEKLAQKEKRQQGMLNKYGVLNPSQNSDIQAKKRNTFKERFGFDNPSKSEVVQNKIKDKWPSAAIKREQTSLAKYGTASYSSTEEFKQRRKETWTAKYGVDNPAKSDIVKDKIFEGQQYKSSNKPVQLAGRIYSVQGYEPLIIQELLKSGIAESEIIIDKKLIPKINYVGPDGLKKRYYPDIWLPRYNMLIEVKSLYTWRKYKELNLLKVKAAKSSGYVVRVMIR